MKPGAAPSRRPGDRPRPFGIILDVQTEQLPMFHQIYTKRHLEASSEHAESMASWALARRRLGGPRLKRERKAHEERTGRAWARRPPGGLAPRHRGRQLGDAARHAGPGG